MTRDHTARARVRDYLLTSGPVEASSGYATNSLRDAIAYAGSPVAFIQLIAAMDRDEEIVREIKGKRTYRIAAGPKLKAGSPTFPARPDAERPSPDDPIEIDYDALARSFVQELWTTPEADRSTDQVTAERSEYVRRLELARDRIDTLLDGVVPTTATLFAKQ